MKLSMSSAIHRLLASHDGFHNRLTMASNGKSTYPLSAKEGNADRPRETEERQMASPIPQARMPRPMSNHEVLSRPFQSRAPVVAVGRVTLIKTSPPPIKAPSRGANCPTRKANPHRGETSQEQPSLVFPPAPLT